MKILVMISVFTVDLQQAAVVRQVYRNIGDNSLRAKLRVLVYNDISFVACWKLQDYKSSPSLNFGHVYNNINHMHAFVMKLKDIDLIV